MSGEGQLTRNPEDGNPFHKKQPFAVGSSGGEKRKPRMTLNDAEAEAFLTYLHDKQKKKELNRSAILEQAIEEWLRKHATEKTQDKTVKKP